MEYHPSEAAHHPPTHGMPGQLPPMQQGPPPPPQQHEPERAARKMDIDEEYDDSGEDEKKPRPASGPSPAGGDMKNNTSPTVMMPNGAPKAE